MPSSTSIDLPMGLLNLLKGIPSAEQKQIVEAVKAFAAESPDVDNNPKDIDVLKVLAHVSHFQNHPAMTAFLPIVRHAAPRDWKVGYEALIYACKMGSLDAIRALLSDGIPFDPPVPKRPKGLNNMFAPLYDAVNDSLNGVLEILVEAGADFRPYLDSDIRVRYDTRAGEGNDLHLAALKDRAGIAQLLIFRGIDVNHLDQFGATPLSRAAEQDNVRTVKALLANGADVNIADSRGRTALSWAAVYGNTRVVSLLLEAGADFNVADKTGHTPFLLAVGKGYHKVVDLLLQRSAPINRQDKYGRTALSIAASLDKHEVVQLLVDRGADINLPSRIGRTPLSYAAGHNARKSGKILIRAGCDQEKREISNRCALDYTSDGVLFPPPSPLMLARMRARAHDAGLRFDEDDCF
ncbi:ankyrin repeat-containing domain protein [Aspergillus venezuelensis]